mgnify:CR=1 FL=1|jgi:Site-specific recombinases, DNA invertase Pin homologs
MIYGYARVSTTGQKEHGNSLDDQVQKLTAAGAEKVFSDAFTGKTMDRPELKKLLNVLQNGDTLICTKLDRFARTAIEGVPMIMDLVDKGVTVNILNMGIASTENAMGKLMITMLLAFAEFEREQIVDRTQTGRKIAMANGVVMGRPNKYAPEKMQLAMELLDGGKSYTQVVKMTGISKSTLIRARKDGVQ